MYIIASVTDEEKRDVMSTKQKWNIHT